jgi:hypothetical protein
MPSHESGGALSIGCGVWVPGQARDDAELIVFAVIVHHTPNILL